jgi:hypothetical protein
MTLSKEEPVPVTEFRTDSVDRVERCLRGGVGHISLLRHSVNVRVSTRHKASARPRVRRICDALGVNSSEDAICLRQLAALTGPT